MATSGTSDTISLLDIPPEILERILSCLSYEQLSTSRLVCRTFDQRCQQLLNQGFTKVDKFHAQCQKELKVQLPRRESERRNHPLARHIDILAAIETRLSLLGMTYMKYVDLGLACFIPGKVLDELFRILHYVKNVNTPPRAHELLQELRDISSMAMEHFDEKILPHVRQKMTQAGISPITMAFANRAEIAVTQPGPASARPIFTQESKPAPTLRHKAATPPGSQKICQFIRTIGNNNKKDISECKNTVKGLKQRVAEQDRRIKEQEEKAEIQNRRLAEQEQKIIDMNRKILEYDQKFVDLTAEIMKVRGQGLAASTGKSADKTGTDISVYLAHDEKQDEKEKDGMVSQESGYTSDNQSSVFDNEEGSTSCTQVMNRCSPIQCGKGKSTKKRKWDQEKGDTVGVKILKY
ncbi:F-box only protein 28 [Lingula anatina]|uniref:F-box only protein 28 n=1 Tax=Lingula anatina TaxID=7574 RepID=A0A1S3K0A8_LINAN|nr:F-box only protein 28 [Lingula anatina]|eukprot:XP_013416068.1 F-box only protein 28 [Lingula anatina]